MKHTAKLFGLVFIFGVMSTASLANSSPRLTELMAIGDDIIDSDVAYLEPFIADHADKKEKVESLYQLLQAQKSQSTENLSNQMQILLRNITLMGHKLDDLSKSKADMNKQKDRLTHALERAQEKNEEANPNAANRLSDLNDKINETEEREHQLLTAINTKRQIALKIKNKMALASRNKNKNSVEKMQLKYDSLVKDTNDIAMHINNFLIRYKSKREF